MSITPNIGLAVLVENQERAEVVVNENSLLLDLLVQPTVVSSRRTDAPVSPSDGQKWCVPPSATGAWSGHGGQLAVWWSGAWKYLIPSEGWTFWDTTNNCYVMFNSSEWRRTIRIPPCSSAPGSTNPRPSSPLEGEQVYDVYIHKPIYWNGSNWKDGTDTTV